MDDIAKNASSYQLDQEILDARGIPMTVEEVAGLSTVKYGERVQSLRLNENDMAFLKGLRRRIKNRLASQNSRRRSMEQLRRLTRELRAVRACRDDTLTERRVLLTQRDAIRDSCQRLRTFIVQSLEDRSDHTEVPDIYLEPSESQLSGSKDRNCNIFECRLEKLVQQSVNHIYRERDTRDRESISIDNRNGDVEVPRKISAKTVFIDKCLSSVKSKSVVLSGDDEVKAVCGEVLNLSMKERRSHGRKQAAPRRITYMYSDDDYVLDLKIKKENQ